MEDIEELAVELGCKVGLLPIVYLGLPLGAHHKAVSIWDGVEERMRKRLAQWKRLYFEGRAYHLNQEYYGQPSYLQYVPFSNAEECCK